MSYTKLVRLPEGSALTLALCDSAGTNGSVRCLLQTRTDWKPEGHADVQLRLGARAYDASFMQLYVGTASCNVSVTLNGGEELLAEVAVVAGCEGTELVLVGGSAWQRQQAVTASKDTLAFAPYGDHLRGSTLVCTEVGGGSLVLPSEVASQPHLALPLAEGRAIGLSSDAAVVGLPAIRQALGAARAAEEARYAAYGEHAEVKRAVQAGVTWNTVWHPLKGVIAPVVRGNPWGWDMSPVSDDWPFVIFDWDTCFAALMLGMDAKALAYSVLISVLQGKAAQGFVPNGYAPTRKSTHSQPPVGSRVLLELWRRHGDTWLVALLFDGLRDWSDWFWAHRRLGPLLITALGGDDMQAARYESGLDNSPMYDGSFFNKSSPDATYGLMQQYDVGMASMAAMSDEALAALADVLNRTEDAATLRARAAEGRALISSHLWDEGSGIFVNRFPSGGFNRRVSRAHPRTLHPRTSTLERGTSPPPCPPGEPHLLLR